VADERLRLMAVHAHPDDESSKGAATLARYVDEGVDVLVVSCTGGERGDVLNPRYGREITDLDEMRAVRREEMAAAAAALGIRQTWLGFVDSGLPEGDPLPPLPGGCFALQPLEVAAAPLVALVREFRPHVMTTYDETGGYPHPDHVMCHRVSVEAFAAAADPERYRGTGEPWSVRKLYYDRPASRARSATGSTPAPPARSRSDRSPRASPAPTGSTAVTPPCGRTRLRSTPRGGSSPRPVAWSARCGPGRSSSSPRRASR